MNALNPAVIAILATLTAMPDCGLAQDTATGNLQASAAGRTLGPERCADLEKRLKAAMRGPLSRARETGIGSEDGRTLARGMARSPELVAYLSCLQGRS